MVVHQRRQRADLLKTRLTIEAMLAPHVKGETKLGDTYQQLVDLLFPYLARAGQAEKQRAVDVLKQWTSQTLKVRPLWRAKDNRRFVSRLRKGAERAQAASSRLQRQKRLD